MKRAEDERNGGQAGLTGPHPQFTTLSSAQMSHLFSGKNVLLRYNAKLA